MTSNLEDIALDVSPAMVSHLTSYYRSYALKAKWIFFNFLGYKNDVYGKLKPLQEKVKYTFFHKLYYRVSRKQNQLKNQLSYRHGGLKKGSLFDYKNGRYAKIRIFLGKRDVPSGAGHVNG